MTRLATVVIVACRMHVSLGKGMFNRRSAVRASLVGIKGNRDAWPYPSRCTHVQYCSLQTLLSSFGH